MKVKITIEERLVREIELEVDASNEDDADIKAREIIKKRINNEEIVLDANDFVERLVETEINGFSTDWSEL